MNWSPSIRRDFIQFEDAKHASIISKLDIGNTPHIWTKDAVILMITLYWDVFDEEGVNRPILGYEYTIDTGSSGPVCCRPPHYRPNESKIIAKHLKVLLSNDQIEECREGGYGAPIVLVAKPR